MNAKLAKFIKANQPLKNISKLDEYTGEILELEKRNYTQDQICEFLRDECQVEVSRQYVSSYILKIKTSQSTTDEELNKDNTINAVINNPVQDLSNFFDKKG